MAVGGENLKGLAVAQASYWAKEAISLDYNPLWREELSRIGLKQI